MELLNHAPAACYERILNCVKDAQNELKRQDGLELADWTLFSSRLEEGSKELLNAIQSISEWTNNQGDLLGFNLRLLNNYYKHLFRRALEDRDKEALSELKYHLMELIVAWER